MEFELIEGISDDADDDLDEDAIFFTRPIVGDDAVIDARCPNEDQAICIPEQEDG
jgi:hypothetical protein